ncbi:sigma-70 family RNA polymerase sigma factor [Streptomyces sp. NPDC089919]|uniref:RNA polymerase sigma factor n=1 Tax=Streptomyces sp. NPDC089919 TaxID=3155188 RepID=UPI003449508A
MTDLPAPPAAQTAGLALPAIGVSRQPDHREFNRLYRSEMGRVTVFLLNLGASPYEAADAAHEAFLTLLPDKWRDLEYPGAWLRTVAYRKYLAQTVQRALPTDPVPDRPGGTCPMELVLLTEEQNDVLEALRLLTPAERHAVVWKMDGFTHEETARATDKDPAAVRQAYARGRKRLISILVLRKGDDSGE